MLLAISLSVNADDRADLVHRLADCAKSHQDINPTYREVVSGVCSVSDGSNNPNLNAQLSNLNQAVSHSFPPFLEQVAITSLKNLALNYAAELQAEGRLGNAQDVVKSLCQSHCSTAQTKEMTQWVNQNLALLKEKVPSLTSAVVCAKVNQEISSLNSILKDPNLYVPGKAAGVAGAPDPSHMSAGAKNLYEKYEKTYLAFASSAPGDLLLTDTLTNQVQAFRDPTGSHDDDSDPYHLDESTTEKGKEDTYKMYDPDAGKNGGAFVYRFHLHSELDCKESGSVIESARAEIRKDFQDQTSTIENDLNHPNLQDAWYNPLQLKQRVLNNYWGDNPEQIAIEQMVYDNPDGVGQLLAKNPEYEPVVCAALMKLGNHAATGNDWMKGTMIGTTVAGVALSLVSAGSSDEAAGALDATMAARLLGIAARVGGAAVAGAGNGFTAGQSLTSWFQYYNADKNADILRQQGITHDNPKQTLQGNSMKPNEGAFVAGELFNLASLVPVDRLGEAIKTLANSSNQALLTGQSVEALSHALKNIATAEKDSNLKTLGLGGKAAAEATIQRARSLIDQAIQAKAKSQFATLSKDAALSSHLSSAKIALGQDKLDDFFWIVSQADESVRAKFLQKLKGMNAKDTEAAVKKVTEKHSCSIKI
jgi:hypothetical protein